jgi:hypothetical protein
MSKKIVSVIPSSKDKEYKVLWFYEHIEPGHVGTLFRLMSDTIRDGSWTYVDLPAVKRNILKDFNYLMISERYHDLRSVSNDTLSYNKEGFELDGHPFQTLKEVEKALKLKSFL